MKTIEEQIHDRFFEGDEFNANDFNDWAKENSEQAYSLCLIIAKELQHENKMLERNCSRAQDLLEKQFNPNQNG